MVADATPEFQKLWRIFCEVDFFGRAGQDMPPPPGALGQAVAAGAPLLPAAYAAPFIAPVQSSLARLVGLAKTGQIRTASVEMIAGAIYQHGPDWPLAAELRRFTAVISDLFRTFLAAEARAGTGLPLREQLPPLAVYSHDGSDGPITIAVDLIDKVLGGKVGVVGLPATFAAHPVLWAALAHETGGHDVTHADPGLLDQLAVGLPAALAGCAPAGALDPAALAALWAYWIDEASADVYGLLNVGPAFAENLALFLAAMNGGPRPVLRMESRADPADPAAMLDPHPADILRLHLLLGAVDSLQSLAAPARAAYTMRILALAEAFADGPDVTIAGTVTTPDGQMRKLDATVPLAQMLAAARAVGAYIATARLPALAGHGIQDIVTWDDADEATVQSLRAAFTADQDFTKGGDDAHFLAAATLALIDDPTRYPAVTTRLNAALDASFRADPIWGLPDVDKLYIRYAKGPI